MRVELTQRAQIALDHLPQSEQKQVQKLIALFPDFPDSPALRGKCHKLNSLLTPNTYIAKVGMKYRAILRLDGETLTILEIAHHDRLDSLVRILQGGKQ